MGGVVTNLKQSGCSRASYSLVLLDYPKSSVTALIRMRFAPQHTSDAHTQSKNSCIRGRS
jgi:hypothetical protein